MFLFKYLSNNSPIPVIVYLPLFCPGLIFSTFCPITTRFILLEIYVNALTPIVVTPFPIIIFSRSEQPSNVLFPIFVTLFGIIMPLILEQFLKAKSLMLVTVLGSIILII